MMELPELVPDLLRRLNAGDLAGVRRRFDAGELEALRPALSDQDWTALPGRLEAGDTGWLRQTLGSVNLGSGLFGGAAGVAAGGLGALGSPAALLGKLAEGGDLSWMRTMFAEGKLDWLKDRLSAADWAELPQRLGANDTDWVRRVLGGLVPGAGALGAAGAGVAAGAGGVASGVGGVASGVGGAMSGVGGGLGWLKWAIPAVVVLGAIGIGATRCGGGSTGTGTAAATTAAAATTGAPTDTAAAGGAGATDSPSAAAATESASAAATDLPSAAATDSPSAAAPTGSPSPVTASESPSPAATSLASTAAPPPVAAGTGVVDYVVYFDTGSATIRPDAAAVITKAAAKIKAGSAVALTGFADLRGNAQANLDLSRRRAVAVESALKKAGANATFTVAARGVATGSDLQKARRVEIDLP